MEIELRFFVESFDTILGYLSHHSSTLNKKIRLVDDWYCPKTASSFQDVEMNKIGTFGLRLRTIDNLDGVVNYEICCKTMVETEDHGLFREYESRLSSLSDAEHILSVIGFKRFCRLEKIRKQYYLGDVQINLEDITNFGKAVELEFISDDVDYGRQKLRTITDALNISPNDIISTSITNRYLQKFATFTDD